MEDKQIDKNVKITKGDGKMAVNVIDSGCGTGKTSYAIQHINNSGYDEKFIYITPFLSEVARIKENCTRKIYEPSQRNSKGSKFEDLKELIIDGKDIVSTHALFKNMDEELADLIKVSGYTLFMDEVMEVVEIKSISMSDWRMLVNDGKLEIMKDNSI